MKKYVSYTIVDNGKVVNKRRVSKPRVSTGFKVKQRYSKISGTARVSLDAIIARVNLLLNPISVRDKALFSRQFATLENAGVPMTRSLVILEEDSPNLRLQKIIMQIRRLVEGGADLSDAMRHYPECFDALYVSMVQAGEKGGVLGEVLERLSKILEDMSTLKNKIKAALAYPVAVGVLAVLIFLAMTIFLIPIFAGIFKRVGSELPQLTLFMLGLSNLLTSWLVVVPIIIGAGLIWFLRKYYKSPEGRFVYDRLLLKIPVLGDLIEKVTIARFCRVFGTLSRSGVPVLAIIPILETTVGNMAIAQAINRAEAYVKEGVPMSQALNRQKIFPKLVLQMISVGEETGELDSMLLKIADFYESEVDQAVKALTSLLEPIMLVLVAGMVGVILLSMYLPMFKVFEKLG